jgi:hypothetical protein
MTVQNYSESAEVIAEIVDGRATGATMRNPEPRPRLDWTVVAPDR